MAEDTKIGWCDATFNPWIGCAKVSAGCKFCYAERDFDHRYKKAVWGKNGTRAITSAANWKKPLKWDGNAEKYGGPFRVFCTAPHAANESNSNAQSATRVLHVVVKIGGPP